MLSESLYFGVFGGDGCFFNGEQIDFWEWFEVQICIQVLNQVSYYVYWGCGVEVCQCIILVMGMVVVIVFQFFIFIGILFERVLLACLDGVIFDQFGFFIENIGVIIVQVGFQFGFEGNIILLVFGDYSVNNVFIDIVFIQLFLNGQDIFWLLDEVYGFVNFCILGLFKGEVSVVWYFNLMFLFGECLEIYGDYVYCCWEFCNISYSWLMLIVCFQVWDVCGNILCFELVSYDFVDVCLVIMFIIILGLAIIFDGQMVFYCFQFLMLDGYLDVSGENIYVVELGMFIDFDLLFIGNVYVFDVNGGIILYELVGVDFDWLIIIIK